MSNNKLTEEQKQLVEDNIGLAMKISNNYFNKNLNMLYNKKLERNDISQITSILVCDCAKRHNAKKGKFSTYLINYLQPLIGREVDKYNSIKIPQRYTWDRNKATSDNEKQDYMSIMYGNLTNLDAPIKDKFGGYASLADIIKSKCDEAFDDLLVYKLIDDNLGEVNANIFKLKMQGYVQSEIARITGLTTIAVKNRFQRSRKILKEILLDGVDHI